MADYKEYLSRLMAGEPVDNPFLDFMGIKAEEVGEGYARFSMEIRPEFLQGAGNIQGGLSIAFSSETAAHAAMTTLSPGENVTTIELKNNFLSMASKGKLTAEATVFKRGRTLIIVDCIVRNDQGKPVSRSSATLMVIAPPA
ncbi:PaaI family thioesterase [Maridesulfovibrio sp.]|uniref:PaaI family thioesterase n=1 Tax=Maridesulfovibrio sp. TaxID=2795000 RepID=UPI002A187CEB|nr:PaaI family thioesterase [Maridesulfovibrio sp.]